MLVGLVLQGDDLGAKGEVFGEEAGGFEFEGADAEGLRGVCSAGGLLALLLREAGFLGVGKGGEERRTWSVRGSGAQSGVLLIRSRWSAYALGLISDTRIDI